MKDKDNKSFWNKISKLYDITVSSNKRAYDEMINLIKEDLNKNMKVLELATGTGVIALQVCNSAKEIVATDFSESMIKVAKSKCNKEKVEFLQQDACNLTFKDKEFDAVIISNALHIMPEPKLALKNIERVLKDDGILIAPTFTHTYTIKDRITNWIMERSGFKTFYKWNVDEYHKFIEDNKFKIIKNRTVKSTFPLEYIVAKKN